MFEIALSNLAKLNFGVIFFNISKYHITKQMTHKIKIANSLDLSFEKIPNTNINNILIATTINNLVNKENENEQNFVIRTVIEDDEDRCDHVRFKFPENFNKLTLEGNGTDIMLDIQPKTYTFFLPSTIKTETIKEEQQYNNESYKGLSLTDKLRCLKSRSKKSIFKTQKGFVQNQRILIYGDLLFKENKTTVLVPKYFIGSGLVELEEFLEMYKHKLNVRLFNCVCFLMFLSILHLTYKLCFRE